MKLISVLFVVSAVFVEGSFFRNRHRIPEDTPVDKSNELATQKATVYNELDCKGTGASFESGGNAFYKEFGPYVKNLKSVRMCGKGIFFYFDTPDMQELATLGHVTRCGKDAPLSKDQCECANLPKETWHLVESFSVEYC